MVTEAFLRAYISEERKRISALQNIIATFFLARNVYPDPNSRQKSSP
jgi:hypothetical protein